MTASREVAILGVEDCSQVENIASSVTRPKRGSKATSDLTNLDLLRTVAVGIVSLQAGNRLLEVRSSVCP